MLKQTENKIFTIYLHCWSTVARVGRALDLWVEGLLVRDSTKSLSQLCPCARHTICFLVLVHPRETDNHPDMTKSLLTGTVSSKTEQNNFTQKYFVYLNPCYSRSTPCLHWISCWVPFFFGINHLLIIKPANDSNLKLHLSRYTLSIKQIYFKASFGTC